MFSINVSISTSSDVWDLTAEENFTITIQLTLPEHAGSPITFRNSKASLFNRRLGEDGSDLLYKSLGENGSALELGRTFVCSFGGRSQQQPLPLNKGINETAFTTLYPGKQYTIVVTHSPRQFQDLVEPMLDNQPSEGGHRRPDFESMGKWPFDHDFGNGDACIYECGISDEAVVSEWWIGTKEDLLAARPPGTWLDDENQLVPACQNVIRYNVVQTAKFLLTRSGDNGK